MSLHKVRQNLASFELLAPHAPAFRAGQHATARNHNLNQARNLQRKQDTRPLVKLFVGFARDDHHHYLKCLRELRRELQAAMRIQNYESTVMDRIRGVMHR